jgi:hypothetical protein
VFLNSSKSEKAILSLLDCGTTGVANSTGAVSIASARSCCDCVDNVGMAAAQVGEVKGNMGYRESGR